MQRLNGSRRSARKRRTSQAYSEYEIEEDMLEPLPPKRSRRILSQGAWSEFQEQCQKLLTQLMQHKHAWAFNQPVDPITLNLPDYFEKIKIPMDFGTIQKKLNESRYTNADEFAADVRLVFTNCWTYNLPGSDIHVMATTLSGIFEKQFKNIKVKESKIQQTDEISEMQNVIAELRSEQQKLLNELTKLVKPTAERSNQPVKPKTQPKPKPKPKKKERKEKIQVQLEAFTVKQKTLLTQKINQLSPEDLQQMVELLSSEIPENQKQNGELEIDLELLSVSTLKKLDQFVDECIKHYKNSDNITIAENAGKSDDSSSSSDSDSSSSDSSDSESEGEKVGPSIGKASEGST